MNPNPHVGALLAVPALADRSPSPVWELVAMLTRLGVELTTTLIGACGHAVTIAPVDQRLTTQQAADLLGVSRPRLVKLLAAGEIPFERPCRHRRVRLAEVLASREWASAERRTALDRMVESADGTDTYEWTVIP